MTENSTIFAKIFPKSEGLLLLKGVDSDYESTVTTEDFMKLKPILCVKKNLSIFSTLILLSFGLMIVLYGILEIDEIRDIYTL